MDSGYTDQDRESTSSGGSSSSKTNAPSSCVLSPRAAKQQMVLEEVDSDDYQPTMEEQLDYAAIIGIDPDREPELMHLALEGLRAQLPANWRPVQMSNEESEGADDVVYYYNFETGQSSWDHPCDEQFRQLVAQERARLRRARRRCGVRFQLSSDRPAGLDESDERTAPQEADAMRARALSREKAKLGMELRVRLEAEETELRAEMQARLEAEEAELRKKLQVRLEAEEAKLRREMEARLEAGQRTVLQRLEQAAEDAREEQQRLLALEMAEKRVEAAAELAELRAEVEHLTRAKADLEHQQQQQQLLLMQQHQRRQSVSEASEETPIVRAKPRGTRIRAVRGISVDEGVTAAAAAAAAAAAENHSREEDDEDRSGASRGPLSTDAIGRARDFLSRHLSEIGFRGGSSAPADADAGGATGAGAAAHSRKRPQQQRDHRLRGRASSAGQGLSLEASLDAGMEAAAAKTSGASKTSAAAAAAAAADTTPEAAAALAAELTKLRCNSLPSLARTEGEETCSETSCEQQPRAKQGHLMSSREAAAGAARISGAAATNSASVATAGMNPPRLQHSQQATLSGCHSHYHHRQTTARVAPPNPRRQRIDWRKVGEKSAADSPEQLQQQQQSTEQKLAQHKTWIFNYARANGLPPSGGKPLAPQG